MNELREKAISELSFELNGLKIQRTENRYKRACNFAFAYQHIGLITVDECDEWVVKFATVLNGGANNE